MNDITYVTCERCGGSGRYNSVYICYGCAGTGRINPEMKRLVCARLFAKYDYTPGDRCTAHKTTPALVTGEERYLVRNWRTGREYALLERQVNEYFREVRRK